MDAVDNRYHDRGFIDYFHRYEGGNEVSPGVMIV